MPARTFQFSLSACTNTIAMEFLPANALSCVMLNDFYQLTMAYAYWKAQKQFAAYWML